VQVVREGFGAKGPRVTSFITLPGRYLVHAPQAAFRGVSRRIHDPGERQRLREIVAALPPAYGGFIVRTAGQGADAAAFRPTPGSSSTPGRRSRGPPNGFPRRASCTPIWTCSSAPCATPRAHRSTG
jgi:hypothetical protein